VGQARGPPPHAIAWGGIFWFFYEKISQKNTAQWKTRGRVFKKSKTTNDPTGITDTVAPRQ